MKEAACIVACAVALAACAHSSTGDATSDAPGSNFALGRPTTGSPICKPGEEVEKVVNGRIQSWTHDKFCSLEKPAWLQVDLGRERTVHSFTVKHAGAAGEDPAMNTRAFRISTSRDGRTWDTAVDVRDNIANVTVHDITPRQLRYVRLDVTEPSQKRDDPATRIYELEVR